MGHLWIKHVEETIKLHPGRKLREVLTLAKKTYRKSPVVAKKHKTRRKHRRSAQRKPSKYHKKHQKHHKKHQKKQKKHHKKPQKKHKKQHKSRGRRK
jgi:hypothetical protein